MPSYSKNKKAYHDYEILEEFEAGIALSGDEVKAIKESQVNLKGAYIDVTAEELFLNEAHVSRYKNSSSKDHDPTRKRKLLLQKKQIYKIEKEISQKGVTAVPLELYSKGGLIKLKFGICRGKKLHDKRDTLKKRSQELDIRQQVKNWKG